MKLAKVVLGTLLGAVFVGGPASAAMLQWDQAQALNSGGQIVFDGTRVVGTNIAFDMMRATGTAKDGVYHCSNAAGFVAVGVTRCLMSFTTGDLSATVGSINIFDPGGTLSITGFLTTATPGNTGPVIGGSPLVLSGTFDLFLFGGSNVGSLGTGSDVKDPKLLEYFGIGESATFSMSQTFTGCRVNGTGGTCSVTSSDFNNEVVLVPEPGSLTLLGLGLLALGAARRRLA